MATVTAKGMTFTVSDEFKNFSNQEQQRELKRLIANQTKINKEVQGYGRYLERQDLRNTIGGESSLKDFALSAGVQGRKVGLGLSGGSPEDARRLEQFNDVLSERSPNANMAGRMAGAVGVAAPLAMGTSAATANATLGLLGRGALASSTGAVEGLAEIPFSEESRLSNMSIGAISGVFSEGAMTALQVGLKRIPFGALVDRAVGLSETVAAKAKDIMGEFGFQYDTLKQSTKDILSTISRADDVDAAVKQAVENEQGFKMTLGEASQDFGQLSAEQSAVRQSQGAGDTMREFKNEQNADIITAGGALADEAGGTAPQNREDVGAIIKKALNDNKAADKTKITVAYDQAKMLRDEGGIDIPLDQSVISKAYYDIAQDHMGTHAGLLNDIGRKLAQYDILDPAKFPSDIPIDLSNAGGFGSLSVANVEDFVKFLNTKYQLDDKTGQLIIEQLKDAVGSNADDILANSIDGVAGREFLSAARAAREINKKYFRLWEAKDVLQETTGVKLGTNTPVKDASDIVRIVTAKPSSARAVIEQLEKNGNTAAVSDLRTFILKDIMDAAVNPNVVRGNNGAFSGAKLTNSINKQKEVLQAVLTREQFAKLTAFEKAVSRVTKYPEGTVNHSNTATKVMDAVFNILSLFQYTQSAFKGTMSEMTINEAVKQNGRKGVDHILKLDKNHIALNTFMRSAMSQYDFNNEAPLADGVLAE
jgi:hypothetical protein|tara:strand:+ start:316 stop:2436 length:2121 start_codon:yes stop_codon:yes gene_type:complete